MKHARLMLIVPLWAAPLIALIALVATADAGAAELRGVQLAALEADPVDAGRDALGHGNRPWYDPDNDTTKRIELSEPWQFGEFEGFDSSWAQALAWSTLALLAVLLIAAVAYVILGWQRPADEAVPGVVHTPQLAAARSELLPVRAGATAEDLRAEAQEHLAAGRYGEAVVCLYSFGLLVLDSSQLIHLARGKTNRQYVRELSRHAALQTPLRQMVEVFEGYFFGGHEVSRQRCEQCLAHVGTIEAAGREARA